MSNFFFDGYGDLYPAWGWVIGLAIITVIIFIGGTIYDKTIANLSKDIEKIGYSDFGDVQVFCKRIDASLEDFIASPGLRKQYELFKDGKISDFIKTAEANKQKSDAE